MSVDVHDGQDIPEEIEARDQESWDGNAPPPAVRICQPISRWPSGLAFPRGPSRLPCTGCAGGSACCCANMCRKPLATKRMWSPRCGRCGTQSASHPMQGNLSAVFL